MFIYRYSCPSSTLSNALLHALFARLIQGCQKQVSRAGTSNYIPQYLWDVITCTWPWYLLQAQHFWIMGLFISLLIMRVILQHWHDNRPAESTYSTYFPYCISQWSYTADALLCFVMVWYLSIYPCFKRDFTGSEAIHLARAQYQWSNPVKCGETCRMGSIRTDKKKKATKFLCIWAALYQMQVSKTGTRYYTPEYLWDVIDKHSLYVVAV